MEVHIDNVATKLLMVGLIAKLRHFVLQHTLLNIYHALILPYLSYGLIICSLDLLRTVNLRLLFPYYFSNQMEIKYIIFSNSIGLIIPRLLV